MSNGECERDEGGWAPISDANSAKAWEGSITTFRTVRDKPNQADKKNTTCYTNIEYTWFSISRSWNYRFLDRIVCSPFTHLRLCGKNLYWSPLGFTAASDKNTEMWSDPFELSKDASKSIHIQINLSRDYRFMRIWTGSMTSITFTAIMLQHLQFGITTKYEFIIWDELYIVTGIKITPLPGTRYWSET